MSLAGTKFTRRRVDDAEEAVILSGGGANGAYEVGVLKALVSGEVKLFKASDDLNPSNNDAQPPIKRVIDPQVFTGTSIGAVNAAYLASQWDKYGPGAVGNLERMWLETLAQQPGARGNGAIRFRGNLLEYMTPSAWVPNPLPAAREIADDFVYFGWEGVQRLVHLATERQEPLTQRLAQLFDFSIFVSTQPLLKTITDTIDFEKIRISKRDLVVSSTNWTSGETEHFANHHMTRKGGPKRVLGSASIPGVFPPTKIGAEPFVDGNVLENTPLEPAIKLGATTFYIIYLDPDIKAIPFSHIRNTVATLYRMQTIGWAGRIKDNIEDVEATNRLLDRYFKSKPAEEAGRRAPEETGKQAGGKTRKKAEEEPPNDEERTRKITGLRRDIESYAPLTIHRFAPTDAIEGGALGLLNVARDRLQDLVRRGFTDASAHDCATAGCVLPTQTAIDAWKDRLMDMLEQKRAEDDVVRMMRRQRAIQTAL